MCKHYSGETHHLPLIWPTLRIHSVKTHIPCNYYKSGAELGSREVKRKEVPEADSLRDGKPAWPPENQSLDQRFKWEWGRSERKYLTRPWGGQGTLTKGDIWAECWKTRMNEYYAWVTGQCYEFQVLTRLFSVYLTSNLKYHPSSTTERYTPTYPSIHQTHLVTFSSENLSLSPLNQHPWDDRIAQPAKLARLRLPAQQRSYSKLTPTQFEFLQEDVDLCCDWRKK